jgi:hypothetical protein
MDAKRAKIIPGLVCEPVSHFRRREFAIVTLEPGPVIAAHFKVAWVASLDCGRQVQLVQRGQELLRYEREAAIAHYSVMPRCPNVIPFKKLVRPGCGIDYGRIRFYKQNEV